MIKNIIFDLDGTLLDTIKDIARALNKTFEAYKLPTVTVSEVTSFIGNGTDLLLQRSLKEIKLSEQTYLNVKRDYLDLQLDYQLERSEAFPGVYAMARTFFKYGIRLFVFSNKPHNFACKLIESRFPHLFTGVLGQKDGAKPKPDLTEYEKFATEHNIIPEESMFVGDSVVDIETGRVLMMPVSAVTWGYVPRQELVAAHPDYVIETAQQLQNIVITINKISDSE